MPIEFRCQSCGKLLRTPDASAGKIGRCPHCKGMMQIPLSAGAETTGTPAAPATPSAPAAPATPSAPAAPATPADRFAPAAPATPKFDILGPANAAAPNLDLNPPATDAPSPLSAQDFAAPSPQGQGYPAQGLPNQPFPQQAFAPTGYPPQGYPQQGYPPQGYPAQNYSAQGYPQAGQPGYAPQNFAPQGFAPAAPAYTPSSRINNPYVASSNVSTGLGAYGGYGSALPHRGGLVLALGIVALVVFCCPLAGLGFSIPTFLMAKNDLDAIDRGRMDPSGRGQTQTGMYLSGAAFVLSVLSLFAWIFIQILGAA